MSPSCHINNYFKYVADARRILWFLFLLVLSTIWSWNILLAHRKVCGHLWIHIKMHFNKTMIFDVYFACLFIFVYLILIYGSLLPPALSSYQDLLILLFHFRCCLLLFPSSCFLTKIKALWGEKKNPSRQNFQLCLASYRKWFTLRHRDNKIGDGVNVGRVSRVEVQLLFFGSSLSKDCKERKSKAKYLTSLLTRIKWRNALSNMLLEKVLWWMPRVDNKIFVLSFYYQNEKINWILVITNFFI